MLEFKEYYKGDFVYKEGDKSDRLFIIKNGKFKKQEYIKVNYKRGILNYKETWYGGNKNFGEQIAKEFKRIKY